jgi:hypothetical protein
LSSFFVLELVALGAEVIAAEEEVTPATDGGEVVVACAVEEAVAWEEDEEAGRVLVTSVLGPFPPLAQ